MKNLNIHISNVNIGNTDTSSFVLNLDKQRYDSANLPMNVGISYTPSGKNIEMDFSWYLGLPAMTRDVLVAGVYKPNLNNPRLFQNGDVYRIWRNNGNVEFYVNGLLDGTFPDKYPDRPMYLEAVFYDVNKKVENLYIYKEVLKTHDTIQTTEMVAKVDGYKRGFNGQERDDEVSGKGNSYTAEFWQYDSRLGRRWNLDPKPNISISPYATFGNNPVMFSDPYGDTIRNRDRQMADNVQNRISNIEKYASSLENEYGINKTISKKDFLKSGGDKAIWNKYQTANERYKESSALYKTLDNRANKTQAIINNWKKSSPNLHALVDEQATDFALSSFTFNPEFDAAYGENLLPLNINSLSKSITIKIADNVNLFTKDFETGEFSLNHEAGHFLYFVKFTSEYIKYYDKNIKEGTYVSGGHGTTDESGKVATKLGQTQDIPKNGLEILKVGN